MLVIEPGHIYELTHLDGDNSTRLTFVNREPGCEHEGTQNQEVLRALIDRVMHCDRKMRWAGNDEIVHHLRMALALHESRALIRKAQKGRYSPELVKTGEDGHFELPVRTAAGGDRHG